MAFHPAIVNRGSDARRWHLANGAIIQLLENDEFTYAGGIRLYYLYTPGAGGYFAVKADGAGRARSTRFRSLATAHRFIAFLTALNRRAYVTHDGIHHYVPSPVGLDAAQALAFTDPGAALLSLN